MKFEVEFVNKKKAAEIIDSREPLGVFCLIDGRFYIGIDNRQWDAWTEEFTDITKCINWLDGYNATLSTFPLNDEDYCHVFTVSRDWLAEELEQNRREIGYGGEDVDDFLEEFYWWQTWKIYQDAKDSDKILKAFCLKR